MKARIKDVPVGTRFDTRVTGRSGVVLAHLPDGVEVVLDRPDERKALHSQVVVEAEEVAH